jgi:hypothetical protein
MKLTPSTAEALAGATRPPVGLGPAQGSARGASAKGSRTGTTRANRRRCQQSWVKLGANDRGKIGFSERPRPSLTERPAQKPYTNGN